MQKSKNVKFDVWNTCYLYESELLEKEKEIIWWSEKDLQSFKMLCIDEIRSILEKHNVSLTKARNMLLNSNDILEQNSTEENDVNYETDNLSELTVTSKNNSSSDSLDSLDEDYPVETWKSRSTNDTWKSVYTQS